MTLTRRHALWLPAALAAAPVRAAEAVRSDVFVAQTNGYFMYRIPGLAVTPQGTLLAYAEARRTTGSDWDAIDIVIRRSTDRGATWSAQQVIGVVPGLTSKNPAYQSRRTDAPPGLTYNNPVAIPDRKKGLVHFVYCVEYMRAFYLRSKDDGRTFSEPVEITGAFEGFRGAYNWKVLATGPGHGIQLKNGRLVVPVWLSTADGANAHHPSVAATIYSDDHGATWHASEVAIPHDGNTVNPSETVAEQLADGSVMLNSRTESAPNRRVIVTNADGATKWSKPRFQEELVEPVCFGSLVRYGKASARGPNRLLFVNPDNLMRGGAAGEPGKGRDRKNLTVQLSDDDGATWKVKRVIDAGYSGYADINVGPKGDIYVLYERGREDPKPPRIGALTLVRFPLEWVLQGQHAERTQP
ncbi:MAG: exo-alpha-sialidase [Bryobacterales bacterium]|nr:exo-alpha-sialidase [Bryobacterales bacterium]